MFFALALVAIVAGAAWALLGSRLLIVRSVQVTGTGSLVSRAQVLDAAKIRFGLPLIRVDTSAAADRVGQLRQVQSAQVSRDWPDTIVISVQIRHAVFAVTVPGGYALVDAFGVDLRQTASLPPGFPVLLVGSSASEPWPRVSAHNSGQAGRHGKTRTHGKTHQPSAIPTPSGIPTPSETPTPSGTVSPAGTSLRGNPAVRGAAAVLRELPPAIAHRITAVRAPTASDVSVRLAGGIVIVWGDTSRPAEKTKELDLLLRTHARIYDVSAPGTAVTQR